MAELCAKHHKHFPVFAAAANLNDVDVSIAEVERAIKSCARGAS